MQPSSTRRWGDRTTAGDADRCNNTAKNTRSAAKAYTEWSAQQYDYPNFVDVPEELLPARLTLYALQVRKAICSQCTQNLRIADVLRHSSR